MKYLKVEGAGRLRLSGGIIGLGSTSRRQGEEGIFDPIYAIPISDPTSEAEAMSQQTYFFVSDFNFCYHLWVRFATICLQVGFWFFFFFLGESVARGFAIFCWACHMLVFSSDWFCFLIYCLGLMLGFGQWACFVTFFFFLQILA